MATTTIIEKMKERNPNLKEDIEKLYRHSLGGRKENFIIDLVKLLRTAESIGLETSSSNIKYDAK